MRITNFCLIALHIVLVSGCGKKDDDDQPTPAPEVVEVLRDGLPTMDASWNVAAATKLVGEISPNDAATIIARDVYVQVYPTIKPPPAHDVFTRMDTVDTLVFHHSAQSKAIIDQAGKDTAGRIETIKNIQVAHAERKFDDIAYHFMIMPNGTIWEGRPLERKDSANTGGFNQGAHVTSFNVNTIGILIVGNFAPYDPELNPAGYIANSDPEFARMPTPAQTAAVADITAVLRKRYASIGKIYTHGHGKAGIAIAPGVSECPGATTETIITALINRHFPQQTTTTLWDEGSL